MQSTNAAAAGLLAIVLSLPALADDEHSRSSDEVIEEIVVAGQQLSADTASIDVIQQPALDTAQVFRRLPGADSNQNGALTGIAQYRGMYGDRVSVSLDGLGVISGGPNAMDTPLSYVSPMITERLILERGIPGVASAPEAIGGHVDAQLARGAFGIDDRFAASGMVGMRYAENGNTASTAGRLTLANQSHRLSLVGESDRADDQQTPRGEILPSRLERNRYDVSYAFQDDATELLAFAGRLDTDDTGTPALAMDIRYIESELYGINVRRAVSPGVTVEARVGYNDVDHAMDNFGLRPAPDSPMQYRQNRTRGSGTVFTALAEIDFGAVLFTGGIDGRLAEHEALITNPNNPAFAIRNFNDVERDVISAFTKLTQSSVDSGWEAGLRYVDVSSNADAVSFAGLMGMMGEQAGLLADQFNSAARDLSFDNIDAVVKYSRYVSPELTLSVDVGSRMRAPSYQELYLWLPLQATGGLADGRSYVGNLALESERSNEMALGFDWSGERFSISPQAYYKDVSDFIQGVPATNMPANMLATMMSGQGALMFDNIDAEIYGLDVGWRYAISNQVSLDGTASYSRGRRTDESDNLYRIAPPNASIAVNFAGQKWTARAEVIGYDGQNDVSVYNGEQQTGGYGIVNGLFTWSPIPSVRVELLATNLFDRAYQDHLAGINRVRDVDIPVGERLYGAERTLTLGAIFTF